MALHAGRIAARLAGLLVERDGGHGLAAGCVQNQAGSLETLHGPGVVVRHQEPFDWFAELAVWERARPKLDRLPFAAVLAEAVFNTGDLREFAFLAPAVAHVV